MTKTVTLYIGTDAGVFFTLNLGTNWMVLGTDLPNSPVFDLNYHQPTKKLVAGTHGRSLFEFDLSVITGVKHEIDPVVNDFVLYQNYPNPFNPSTTINFTIREKEYVTLKVYDIMGNEVALLLSEEMEAGSHSIKYDASGLASGIYLYKLKAGNKIETRKMLLLK